VLSSARSFVTFDKGFVTIGERINPTGKKDLQAALLKSDMNAVFELARTQQKAGAQVLDVNVGMSDIDEPSLLKTAVFELSSRVDAPLCIDTANTKALEGALRIYPGRALVNSVPAEEGRMEQVLDLCKKYGAMFIALPIGKEVPETARQRTALIEKILSAASERGMGPEFALCDPLVMPVSANGEAALATLDVVEWCSSKGLLTTMGLSNVSFGLPQREWINAALLALAMAKGLSSAILNPSVETLGNIKLASKLLLGQDPAAASYISRWSQQEDPACGPPIYSAVVAGDYSGIAEIVKSQLESTEPQEILNNQILPALEEVGQRFERHTTFLPQLLQSAQAVQNAMSVLEPLLLKSGVEKKAVKIVMATVEGDIHDIGKNIVALVLKNHGYQVIDLGKDVPAQTIVDTALSQGASIIGLSALITTTMIQMKKVVLLLKERSCSIPVMVGGAVVTPEYARSIGAEYAADAMEAVRVAARLTGDARR
jgi:5-methyltetrahydrofolate--homocysteine methyltransferase